MFDIVLKGGTVIDPSQGLDGVMDVAIHGGKIVAVEADIPESEAWRLLGVPGKLVVPGLVDLHAHMYWGATRIGADPDETCLKHGVTTVVDCGTCGAQNFPGFRKWIVGGSRTTVYAFVHISVPGLEAAHMGGEMAHVDLKATLELLRRYPEVALGVKLRATESAVGGPFLPMLKMGREVADEAGVPIMVHLGDSVETLPQIMDGLRPGDIVSHCMTGMRNGLLDDQGRILPEVKEARERGLYFDVAIGNKNFSFKVAQRLLDQGFVPDSISSDLTLGGATGPVYDLPSVMTRFVAMGLPLAEVVRLSTIRPAQVLGMADRHGSLRPGVAADVAVLQWREGEFTLKSSRDQLTVQRRLAPYLTIKDGQVA